MIDHGTRRVSDSMHTLDYISLNSDYGIDLSTGKKKSTAALLFPQLNRSGHLFALVEIQVY